MDRLELYREIYKREIERRNELNNDLNIPIGLITFLATAAFFYLSNFKFKSYDWLTDAFALFIVVGFSFLSNSIRLLILSFNIFTGKEKYEYIPFADDLERYYEQSVQYYLSTGSSQSDALSKANHDFETNLCNLYIRNATLNTTTNDKRSTDIFRCKKNIALSLTCFAIAFIPFMLSYYSKPDQVQKIEIINKIH